MNAIIIDDHPLAIAAIRNLLIKNDIEILAELTEGGSAVQRVETLKPDIVIIDVDIPGVNGIQVLETLRKRQYSGIIIIVSAKNDHFYGKHCADAGAVHLCAGAQCVHGGHYGSGRRCFQPCCGANSVQKGSCLT